MNQIQILIGSVFAVMIISTGFYVKSLNDQVVKCKANTKIQQDRYDRDIKTYTDNIADIVKFYDSEIENVDTFKRTSNETDCQATKRFFNRVNY